MLKNIAISKHKILERTLLHELGRVNIICGRNDSGKSTLVEAICRPNGIAPGRSLSKADAQLIFDQTSHYMGWSDSTPNRPENIALLSLLEQIATGRHLWFRDESDDFALTIQDSFMTRNSNDWTFAKSRVAEAFQALLPVDHIPLLIPAKRRLDATKKQEVTLDPKPDGTGLLDRLHYLKNQLPSSDDASLLKSLKASFAIVTKGYQFETSLNKTGDLALSFSRDDLLWLPAADCGLGLQDLLLILYFCLEPRSNLIAIEEPESHLHPDAQRRLLTHLREMTNKQYFLTTHSNVFLDNLYTDRVFITKASGSILVEEATSRASMLDDLGYSVADNLIADVVVLVEGPTDVPAIEVFAKKKGLLDRYSIKIWPLGGDIMDQLDLSVMAAAYKTIALIDQDPHSDKIRRRFIKRCTDQGIPFVRLERNAIENYFSIRSLRAVFGTQVPAEIQEIAPNKSVESQLGFSPKKRNRALAEEMNLDEIAGTDFAGFFEKLERLAGGQEKDG